MCQPPQCGIFYPRGCIKESVIPRLVRNCPTRLNISIENIHTYIRAYIHTQIQFYWFDFQFNPTSTLGSFSFTFKKLASHHFVVLFLDEVWKSLGDPRTGDPAAFSFPWTSSVDNCAADDCDRQGQENISIFVCGGGGEKGWREKIKIK